MRGLSLVEVMVSIVIFASLSATLFGILSTGSLVYMKDTTLLDLQQQARNAMGRIVRDVRESKAHTITHMGSGDDKIVFDTSIKQGLQYYRSGDRLVRIDPTGVTGNVASNITGLSLTPLTGNVITIVITAQRAVYNQAVSFALTQKVRLRNE